MNAPKWDPIPVGGCCGEDQSAPTGGGQYDPYAGQQCNTKADDPYVYAKDYIHTYDEQTERAQAVPEAIGTLFHDVRLTQAELLTIARQCPTLRPVLESLAPEAFYEVVNVAQVFAETVGRDTQITLDGPYKDLGLDLSLSYQWELTVGSFGIGQALVARRRL